MTTNASNHVEKDLDTLIREAELRVIAADRDWNLHREQARESTQQLVTTVRGKAGRVALWGGVFIGTLTLGGALIRWRYAVRAEARAKALLQTAWKMPWRAAAAAAPPPPPPAASSPWLSVVAIVGTVLGAVVRSSLRLPKGTGGASLVGSVLPMLTRWWRARAAAPAPKRPMPPAQPPRPRV